MTAIAATRPRVWVARHGMLIALTVIVLVGLALRVDSALEPLDVRPGTDSAVYASVAEQLYEHQRFALPGAASPYDWSPGAPLFYASVYYATGGVHPGAVRGAHRRSECSGLADARHIHGLAEDVREELAQGGAPGAAAG